VRTVEKVNCLQNITDGLKLTDQLDTCVTSQVMKFSELILGLFKGIVSTEDVMQS
jgi:hypothetical protein